MTSFNIRNKVLIQGIVPSCKYQRPLSQTFALYIWPVPESQCLCPLTRLTTSFERCRRDTEKIMLTINEGIVSPRCLPVFCSHDRKRFDTLTAQDVGSIARKTSEKWSSINFKSFDIYIIQS